MKSIIISIQEAELTKNKSLNNTVSMYEVMYGVYCEKITEYNIIKLKLAFSNLKLSILKSLI